MFDLMVENWLDSIQERPDVEAMNIGMFKGGLWIRMLSCGFEII